MNIYKQFWRSDCERWMTYKLIRENDKLVWSWWSCDYEDGYGHPLKEIPQSDFITTGSLDISYEKSPL